MSDSDDEQPSSAHPHEISAIETSPVGKDTAHRQKSVIRRKHLTQIEATNLLTEYAKLGPFPPHGAKGSLCDRFGVCRDTGACLLKKHKDAMAQGVSYDIRRKIWIRSSQVNHS